MAMEKITRSNFYFRFTYGLTALALATLPFTRALIGPIAVAMLLLLIIDNRWKENFNSLKSNNLLPFVIISSAIFLTSLIGTLYSQNTSKAISDWEYKFLFFAFPLCIFPIIDNISIKQFRTLIVIFCSATLSVALINFVISAIFFARTGDSQQFFYIYATHLPLKHHTHPSYLSMYACVNWVMAAYFLIKSEAEGRWEKIIFWLCLFIFPIDIFLMNSKAGILIFGIFLLTIIVLLINRKRKRTVLTISVMLACLALALGGILYLWKTNEGRIGHALNSLMTANYDNPYDGTSQRVVVWKTALELSLENLPMGVGSGDVDNTLFQRYQDSGYTGLFAKKLNCHNQYLQNFLGTGLIGLGVILLFLIHPLVWAKKRRDFLLASFILIIGFNMLVESMLEIHAGTDFISLMYALLAARSAVKPIECKRSA